MSLARAQATTPAWAHRNRPRHVRVWLVEQACAARGSASPASRQPPALEQSLLGTHDADRKGLVERVRWRCRCSSESLPGIKVTGLRRTTRRPAGGVLDADHVRSGDDSIDVADLVGENQLDVGRTLD